MPNYFGAHFILTSDLWKEQLGLISGFSFVFFSSFKILWVQFISVFYDVSVLNISSQIKPS